MTDDSAAHTAPSDDTTGTVNPRAGTGRYPVQMVVMVTEPVAQLVTDLATERGLYKTEVLRILINAGIRKAGYGAILKTDTRTSTIGITGPGTREG